MDLNSFYKSDIFTPTDISFVMTSFLNSNGSLLEPSVGKGNLLSDINFDNYTNVDVYEIKKEYLDDFIYNHPNIHKNNQDFLLTNIDKSYDNIIMNPPYIKIQDLPVDYRSFIKSNFPQLKNGIIDIYYPFIIKSLNLLKDDTGVMVAVTPNSFLYNKSAANLRKFLLFDNTFIKEIIDFKSEKVFKGVSVYCCITVFTKTKKDFLIYNDTIISYSSISSNNNFSIFNINPNANPNPNPNENKNKILEDICKISNGVATLRDKIYIHKKKLFDEPCWIKITSGKETFDIIYPYYNNNGIITIIEETEFKNKNPLTYAYLLSNKEELEKRDKGNKKYSSWYAYGRTQSIKPLKPSSSFLLISTMLNPMQIKNFIFDVNTNNNDNQNLMLFYKCLCIEPLIPNSIDIIKNTIINNHELISSLSSKRTSNWINVSNSVLYKLPI